MPSPVEKTEKVAKNIERAKELKQQGSLDQAIDEFNTALKQAPKSFVALNQLAILYAMQENWQEVINSCYRILGLRPNNATAYLRLAKACAKQNNLYGAVAAFQKAIELDANAVKASDYKQHADILTELGSRKGKKTQADEAIAAYQKALELKSDLPARVHIKLGNALQKEQRFGEAIESYKKAFQVKPDQSESIYISLGQAQMEEGLIDEAIANLQKAVQMKPEIVNVHRNLGNAYQKKGLLENAMAHYQKAIELNPKAVGSYRLMGDILRQQGRTSEADKYYQRAKSIQ